MTAKKKEIVKNTIYTIGGALVLNGVLQLFIYPRLTKELGSSAMGDLIFIMGLIGILGPSVGQALNTGRLVTRRDYEVKNGDYNTLILLLCAVGSIIAVFAAGIEAAGGFGGILLLIACAFLTVFRYYGDVDFRMSLNYRHYFLYYLIASAGYVAGYFLYRAIGSWYLIFILGELLAIFFVFFKGSIFKSFFACGENRKIVYIRGLTLVGSYFITNLTLNIDKILLKPLIGSDAVTFYYVASLLGKTLFLLAAPINTIIISYLTADQKRINQKQFTKFVLAGLGVSAVFFLVCQIGTPIFVRLFYPELANDVDGILTIVNITQILGILSAYLFIVVLTFTKEKWQLIFQGCHLAVAVALSVWLSFDGGLTGFSTGLLIANALRVAAVLILGYGALMKHKKSEKGNL